MASFDIREIDLFSTAKNPEYANKLQDRTIKKLYACADKKSEDLYFVIFTMNSNKTMLLFNPNEKMVKEFDRINPQKVKLDI